MMAKRLVLTLVGTMAASAAPLILAGPPMPYGQWSVNNGNITAQCTTGIECSPVPLAGPGMLQREISSLDGKFFQNIITNSDATGTPQTLSFSSESFVRQGWASSTSVNGDHVTDSGVGISGIALNQVVNQPNGNGVVGQGGLNLTTKIHTGWADDSSTPTIEIMQSTDTPLANTSVSNVFRYLQNQDADGNQTGVSLDNDFLGTNMRFFDPIKARESMPQDIQHFVRRRRAGDLNPGAQGGFSGGGGDNGDDRDNGSLMIPLPAGADVQVTWAGMYYTGEDGPTSIGYQAFDNLDDTIFPRHRQEREGAPGRPWAWDNLFGPMPTMPGNRPNGD